MIEARVLTVAEAAEILGVKPGSVRVTMNRRGYGEIRGYNETDVLAVRDSRQRRRPSPPDHSEPEDPT